MLYFTYFYFLDVFSDIIFFSQTCHIARKRTYSETDHNNIDIRIQRLLESKNCRLSLEDGSTESDSQHSVISSELGHSQGGTDHGGQFLPREAKEKVRNCTQVDKDVRETIVNKVVATLLSSENRLDMDVNEDSLTSKGFNITEWNVGGECVLFICSFECYLLLFLWNLHSWDRRRTS